MVTPVGPDWHCLTAALQLLCNFFSTVSCDKFSALWNDKYISKLSKFLNNYHIQEPIRFTEEHAKVLIRAVDIADVHKKYKAQKSLS